MILLEIKNRIIDDILRLKFKNAIAGYVFVDFYVSYLSDNNVKRKQLLVEIYKISASLEPGSITWLIFCIKVYVIQLKYAS